MQALLLSQSHRSFHMTTQFFCFRQSRLDSPVFNQRSHKTTNQRLPGPRLTSEGTYSRSMSHTITLFSAIARARAYQDSFRTDAGAVFGSHPAGGQPSTFMPRLSPISDKISLISFKDLRPKFLVFNISASLFATSSPI